MNIRSKQQNRILKGKCLLEIPEDYTVLDLETTGVYPYPLSEIIEIAMVKVRGNKIIDQFQTLVKPAKKIPNQATKKNGISNEDVSNAPCIEQVISKAFSFSQNDIIVAHNANFDINMFYDNVYKHLGIAFSNDFVDTLPIARKVYPEFGDHSLDSLCCNIPLDNKNTHRALAD